MEQRGPGFDKTLLAPLTDVYLAGYWQSERFFADAADTIRTDFQFTTPPDPDNADHLERIRAAPAISLHIRRGDYLRPEVQAQFGSPTAKYYSDAIDLIASRMAVEPVVYVFSDEPELTRDNLVLPFEKRVVAHNGPDKNYEDMRLMSACRHHVIANSSFSWWGAWLNPSPDKIVVAPKRWFIDLKIDNPDIAPSSWFRMDG